MNKNCMGNNILNNLLCFLNPKMPISNSHYVCGSNLAMFSNLAQIENCLTSLTGKCKNVPNNLNTCFRDDDKK